MYTVSFIMHLKTEDFCEDIANDVEKQFDISRRYIRKKQKEQKKCVIKRILKFNDYKGCLLRNEIKLKSQQRFKSEANYVY